MLLSGFFIWQVIEGIKLSDSYGISTSIIVIFMLFMGGIIGILAAVRQNKYCMNTFAAFASIIIIFSIIDIGIIAAGTAMCGKLGSEGDNAVWNFICTTSSWILLIPLAILIVLLTLGLVFRCTLGRALTEEETGSTSELSNYYPS